MSDIRRGGDEKGTSRMRKGTEGDGKDEVGIKKIGTG
jgi:hypothetical protein